MAYKRRTTKTGKNSRRSVTYNTNGPTTFSHSNNAGGGVTYTHTSKGGKYYTTRTQRGLDGYVTRQRVSSSSPKKAPSRRRQSNSNDNGFGAVGLIVFGVIVLISFIFGS
jgi:hypothetical protein